ncbi:MAG: DUF4136 domain-containing protein [Halioglobus sp.]|nr:DUF4136 domain-containing protein [Halioglobus sp.]
MTYSRFLPLIALCLAALLSACNNLYSTSSAIIDYNRNYDFSRVRTIAMQPIPRDTVETMMTSDALIVSINEALTAELQQRGFRIATEDSYADMFLSWRFVPQQSTTVSTFDPATQQVIEATIFVDMIDPVILQTVWRANFRAQLDTQVDTDGTGEFSRKAASAILAQFPPISIAR